MTDFTLRDNIYYYQTKDDFTIAINSNLGGYSNAEYSFFNLALHVGDKQDTVLENRKLYCQKLNVDIENNIYMQQTHSNNCHQVQEKDKGKGLTEFDDGIPDTDGIYTFENDLVLNAMCADCTPVYFYSSKDNLYGVIHAGWQGTLKQVTYHTLNDIISNHNINPENIKIVIGPAINIESFEVDKDVFDLFNEANLLTIDDYYTKGSKYHINIKQLNAKQCQKLGVKDIFVSNIDTYTTDELYSFRQNNKTGRMCATIFKNKN